MKRYFICHIDIVKADYNYALIHGLYTDRIFVELENISELTHVFRRC